MILQRLITIFLLIAIVAAPAVAAVFLLVPDEMADMANMADMADMADMECCTKAEGMECSSMAVNNMSSEECPAICLCEIKDEPVNPGLLTTNPTLPNPQASSPALAFATNLQRSACGRITGNTKFLLYTANPCINPGCLRI